MTEQDLTERADERVRTLGLVFLGLGCVELAWVFFCVFGGLILGVAGFAPIDQGEYLWLGMAAYWVIGLGCTPIALLHVGTGLRLRHRRKGGMTLAVVSLASCMVTMVLALYCFPFTLGACIYALMVLTDPDARAVMDAD
jgi:hypothetical protein